MSLVLDDPVAARWCFGDASLPPLATLAIGLRKAAKRAGVTIF